MSRARTLGIAVIAITLLVAACTSSAPKPTPPAPTPVAPTSSAPSSPAAPSGPSSDGPSGPVSAPGLNIRTVPLSRLNGATVPTTFILADDTPRISKSKFFLTTSGKTFLASVKAAPFETAITVPAGHNTVEVRHEINGDRAEVNVAFTAHAGMLESSSTPTPPGPAPTIVVPAPTVQVSSSDQLADALQHATPGTVIRLADGEYQNDGGKRWNLAKSGTASAPITLEGGRGAVIESDSTSGDYGLWITGNYWQVLGITVRNAAKGIVLDHSSHTVIDGVEVADIGYEGVHFRTCSSWDVLQNSYVHDTGMKSQAYGEGVYVGSANSNWSKYGCSNGQDKSEHALVRANRFSHIAAEGADLKEGTDSGWLLDNVFEDAGYSGENSADSAVDVKGNGWLISGNTATDPQGADVDAFQTHSVYDGYGTANVFTHNTVDGSWPGFGFGLYPALANIVTCDNTAAGATKGLVGDNNAPARCAS